MTRKDILPVKEFNALQDERYKNYCEGCKNNGVQPLPQDRYFPKFNYKTGYVIDTLYPIRKRRKKDFY